MDGALITLLNARDVEFTRRDRVTLPPLCSLPTSLRRAARCLVATQLLSRSVHHAESELTWARSHLELVSVAVLGLEGGDDDGDDGGALAALASRDPPAPVVAGAPPAWHDLKEVATRKLYAKFMRVVAPYRLDEASLLAAESLRLECTAAATAGIDVDLVAWALMRDWLVCAACAGRYVGRTAIALRRLCVALQLDEARLVLATATLGEALRCETAVLREIEAGASDAALQRSRMKWLKRAALIGGVSAVAIGAAVITGGLAAPAIAGALGAGATAAGVAGGAAAAGAAAGAAGAAGAGAAAGGAAATSAGVSALIAGSAFFASSTGVLVTAGTFGAVSGGLTAYTVHYRTCGIRDFSFVRCCDEDTAALSIVICVSGFARSEEDAAFMAPWGVTDLNHSGGAGARSTSEQASADLAHIQSAAAAERMELVRGRGKKGGSFASFLEEARSHVASSVVGARMAVDSSFRQQQLARLRSEHAKGARRNWEVLSIEGWQSELRKFLCVHHHLGGVEFSGGVEDAERESAIDVALVELMDEYVHGGVAGSTEGATEEGADAAPTRTVEWANLAAEPKCMTCRKTFGNVFRKQVHCRACGHAFCSRCIWRSRVLPRFGYTRPVQVCDACFGVEDPLEQRWCTLGAGIAARCTALAAAEGAEVSAAAAAAAAADSAVLGGAASSRPDAPSDAGAPSDAAGAGGGGAAIVEVEVEKEEGKRGRAVEARETQLRRLHSLMHHLTSLYGAEAVEDHFAWTHAHSWQAELVSHHATAHYTLVWERHELAKLGNLLTEIIGVGGVEVLKQAIKWAANPITTIAGAAFAPFAIALTVVRQLVITWSVGLDRAIKAGRVLADVIASSDVYGTRPVTLIATSLGARMIFECLLDLAKRGIVTRVADVVLLGCPVTTSAAAWRKARTAVSGRFVNGFAPDDQVLKLLYRVGGWSKLTLRGLEGDYAWSVGSVAGLHPVHVVGVENIDIGNCIKNHGALGEGARIEHILRTIGFGFSVYSTFQTRLGELPQAAEMRAELSASMTNEFVFKLIKQDMLAFIERETRRKREADEDGATDDADVNAGGGGDDGAAGEGGGGRSSVGVVLSAWTHHSEWANDTGGQLDDSGAPLRAQAGKWQSLWNEALAEHAALAAQREDHSAARGAALSEADDASFDSDGFAFFDATSADNESDDNEVEDAAASAPDGDGDAKEEDEGGGERSPSSAVPGAILSAQLFARAGAKARKTRFEWSAKRSCWVVPPMPAARSEILEGFLCPVCRVQLRSQAELLQHFETVHGEDDKSGAKDDKTLDKSGAGVGVDGELGGGVDITEEEDLDYHTFDLLSALGADRDTGIAVRAAVSVAAAAADACAAVALESTLEVNAAVQSAAVSCDAALVAASAGAAAAAAAAEKASACLVAREISI